MQLLERSLADEAMEHLRGTGLLVSLQTTPLYEDRGIDAELQVRWPSGSHSFAVVVKQRLEATAVELLPRVEGGGVLLTRHASPNLRLALDDAGWGHLDRAGNASLTAPGLFVRIEGRRPRRDTSTPPVELPFTKTGLPVTFVALVRGAEGDIGPQRELAELAHSSLGTTNRVLQGLRALDFLGTNGHLRRRHLLIDRWIEAYLIHRDHLAPSQRFTSDRWTSPRDISATSVPPGAYLGSEAAATARGLSIRPERILVYCAPSERKAMIREARLRPDPEGWVELRRSFWSPALLGPDAQTVPNFLMRADLLAESDPRLSAVAKRLGR